ncbi:MULTISPECIES: hypothetical protein [Acinetobacter]|uniref:hypothetical protein n=1 Tax=Acinetobacter TaxID=469 RepID=UPI00114CFFEA|nr:MULTISPECIES: hypothetical protein [Acinetobacter]
MKSQLSRASCTHLKSRALKWVHGVKLASSSAALNPDCRAHSAWRNSGGQQCCPKSLNYSHSIVAGGLDDTS